MGLRDRTRSAKAMAKPRHMETPSHALANKRDEPAEPIDAIEVPSLTRLCDRKANRS